MFGCITAIIGMGASKFVLLLSWIGVHPIHMAQQKLVDSLILFGTWSQVI
jgi:hypothetical protein